MPRDLRLEIRPHPQSALAPQCRGTVPNPPGGGLAGDRRDGYWRIMRTSPGIRPTQAISYDLIFGLGILWRAAAFPWAAVTWLMPASPLDGIGLRCG
jgi:hypothetical protein